MMEYKSKKLRWKVFVTVCRYGPQTASEVNNRVKEKVFMTTYRTLQQLVTDGVFVRKGEKYGLSRKYHSTMVDLLDQSSQLSTALY